MSIQESRAYLARRRSEWHAALSQGFVARRHAKCHLRIAIDLARSARLTDDYTTLTEGGAR